MGTWTVRPGSQRPDGESTGFAVWRSAARLPVTDARPELRVDGRLVAVPTLTPDGHGLAVPLRLLGGVDTRRLEVWLGADRLDRSGASSLGPAGDAGAGAFRDVDVLDVDPGVPGDGEVGAVFDYTAAALPWPEYDRSLEVLGHVVLPAGVDDAPLVLFLHGRHNVCYRPGAGAALPDAAPGPRRAGQWHCPGAQQPVPSYLGYEYVQRLLATQGFASVSISANAINAQDDASLDAGADARSALVRHHLDLIAQWADDPGRPRWNGRVDVDRTVLVGHSRGGEGVARASTDAPADAPWSLLGLVLVAPTDFARLSTPYTPSVTLLPYCDGDVSDLQGQQYTDLPRDLTADDTAFRSSVLMRGANHNFFNTEWTPGVSVAPSFDDWFDDNHPLCGKAAPHRLTGAQQRAAGKAWIAAAVQVFETGDTEMLQVLDRPNAFTVPSAAAAAVRTEAIGGDRTLLRPGVDGAVTGAGTLCRSIGTQGAFAPPCAQGVRAFRKPHWSNLPVPVASPTELVLRWSQAGVGSGLFLDEPADLSAPGTSVDLRTVVDPQMEGQRVRIRLTDTDGDAWQTEPRTLHGLVGGYLRTYWAQTLRLAPQRAPARIDLTDVASIGFASASPTGRVWLLDAAIRQPGLLPVPDTRVPTLSLGRTVVVDEGDGPGQASATMTYRLDAPAPQPGRLTVAATTYDDGVVTRGIKVDVPAGATAGTFEVPYEADEVDDVQRTEIYLQAIGERSVVIGDALSRVVVRDDDPDARLSVRRATPSVAPGRPMVWQLRLDQPADYPVSVRVRGVVTGTPPDLLVSDVPAGWADANLSGGVGPGDHVAEGFRVRALLRPGERTARLVVPTRAQPPRPGSRVLTLRFSDPLLPDDAVLRSIRRR